MVKQSFEEFVVANIEEEILWFRKVLTNDGLAKNTVDSYAWTVRNFLDVQNGIVSPQSLLSYKAQLIDKMAPQTVNNRMNGLNRYLIEKDINYHVRQIKLDNEQYNDKVISMQDYIYLKNRLLEDENYFDYFLVWAFGCTGARISELLQIKVEHIYDGIFHIYGKGLKPRTIFISNQFCTEMKEYLETIGKRSGFIFANKKGEPLSKAGVEARIRTLAYRYDLDPVVMHPHSFRHLFAKSFNNKNPNLVLLKDIMGHSSISTTALYCKPSMQEIIEEYNATVDW